MNTQQDKLIEDLLRDLDLPVKHPDHSKPISMQYLDAIGYEKACNQTMEECSELIKATSKLQRFLFGLDYGIKVDPKLVDQFIDNLAEEITDVMICIEWQKKIWNIDDKKLEECRKKKDKRFAERLQTGNLF